MSKDFWDKRYSEEEFAYGTTPNEFVKSVIDKLKPGKALFLGEGEGRNAVYAASLGWNVDAVDFSESAKKKALKLASDNNVVINYTISDLENYQFIENKYDMIVMVFLHLPAKINQIIFEGSISSLKVAGKLIIETFSKEQINNSSGGPKDLQLLFSESELLDLTFQLQTNFLESKTIYLNEGAYHIGKADVIRYVGVKI